MDSFTKELSNYRAIEFARAASRRGLTLVEVLVAVALAALFIIAAVSLITPALRVNNAVNTAQTAGSLGKELADNVRAWAGGNWNNVLNLATSSANMYYLNTAASPFTAVGGSELIKIGSSTYSRSFYVSDMFRDSNGNPTSTSNGGSNRYDPSAKQITVTVNAATFTGPIGAWVNSSTTPLPGVLESHAAIVNNGYIYTTGGIQAGGGVPTTTVQYAAIKSGGSLGSWLTATSLPVGIYQHAAVVSNGYIYTIGGTLNGGTDTTTVQYAPINPNGSIGSWSATTPLPSRLDSFSAAVSNGYVYVTGGGGGSGGSGVTSTVQYALINPNGSIGPWATSTNLPGVLENHAAIVNNSYLYTVGGVQAGGAAPTATVQYAPINSNGSIGSWSATTPLPVGLQEHAGIAFNGYVYTIGGYGTSSVSEVTTTVQYAQFNANGSLGSWSTLTALPSKLDSFSTVISNGYIYTTGGGNGSGVTSTVNSTAFTTAPAQQTQTYSFIITRNSNNALDQTDWSGGAYAVSSTVATTTNSNFSTSTKIDYTTTPGSIALATAPSIYTALVDSAISGGCGTNIYSACQNNTGTIPVVFSNGPAAGNLVIVAVSTFNATATAPTDSAGNSYTLAKSINNITNTLGCCTYPVGLSLYYAMNVNASATFIVNEATTGFNATSSATVSAFAFSGFSSTSALDQTNASSSNAGSAMTFPTGNITTSAANELVFAALTQTAFTDLLNPTSTIWSSGLTDADNKEYQSLYTLYDVAVAPTTISAVWNGYVADHYEAIITAFKP